MTGQRTPGRYLSRTTSCSPCPMEEPEPADSHPRPESWAQLGTGRDTAGSAWFTPVSCHGPQPSSSPSSEVPTPPLPLGQPRWSAAGEAEPAEGPTRGGGLSHHRLRTHRPNTGTCTRFPMGIQPRCRPALQPGPLNTNFLREPGWARDLGTGVRQLQASREGERSHSPRLVGRTQDFC